MQPRLAAFLYDEQTGRNQRSNMSRLRAPTASSIVSSTSFAATSASDLQQLHLAARMNDAIGVDDSD
jgi:hypothetical protein